MYDHDSAIAATLAANHVTYKHGTRLVSIYKEGKHFSHIEVDADAGPVEVGYAVLAEHFRIMHLLETFPKYKPNGMARIQAVYYWASTDGNFDKFRVICELLEHCLANTSIWRGYDAFNFGGELVGYNDDVVHEAISQGDRFMTFGSDFDRAAIWAEAHGYGQLSDALQAVQEMPGKREDIPRAIMTKAHDNLVDAFWEVFKALANREEKKAAMQYAFDK